MHLRAVGWGVRGAPRLRRTARVPPQTEFLLDPGGVEAEEVAPAYPPDDLDQSPDFDPAEPEPVPDDHFDQSRGW